MTHTTKQFVMAAILCLAGLFLFVACKKEINASNAVEAAPQNLAADFRAGNPEDFAISKTTAIDLLKTSPDKRTVTEIQKQIASGTDVEFRYVAAPNQFGQSSETISIPPDLIVTCEVCVTITAPSGLKVRRCVPITCPITRPSPTTTARR